MALFALSYMRALLGRIRTEELAQDTFEYLLIIGGVSVAVIAAIATPLGGAMVGAVIDGVCTAIGSIDAMPTNMDCTPA